MLHKKGLIKLIVTLLVIVLLSPFIVQLYLKNTWDNFMSEKMLTEFVTKVKYANELPDRFYELYEEKHPDILSKNLNQQITSGLFSQHFTKSPSLLAAMISETSREDNDSTKISNRKAYTLAWKLEEETTQRECLNWVLENYKFDLYIHGIDEVANFYFKKGVADLEEKELADIIALMNKPSIIAVPDRSNEQY